MKYNLQLFYRFVEPGIPEPTILPNVIPYVSLNYTSIWAHANSKIDQFSSGTYFLWPDNSISRGGLDGSIVINTSSIEFNVLIPFLSSKNMILIVKVGLPTNVGATFEYINVDVEII